MIKLVKSTFYDEKNTKKKLVDFILRTDILSMGEETRKFEKNFAKKQGKKHAVFVNSGSTANLVLLQALLNLGRLKAGARVGISAVTWSTNVMPIIQLGLRPIAIDCELETLNVSPRTLKKHLGKLDALFLTNVLGLADDIGVIEKLCKKHNILFLEDNCESLGSKTAGKLLGNFGLAATFSFFVGHHLSTIEGGMIVTDDEELYHQLMMVRAHGWSRNLPISQRVNLKKKHQVEDFFDWYTFYDLAYNVRPTDIHGFVGNVQLPYLDQIVRRREKNFYALKPVLDKNPYILDLRVKHMNIFSNFAVPLIFKNREMFEKYRLAFEKAGVEIRPIIAGNMLRQPFYKKYVKNREDCPNADYIHNHGFYFGNNPELTSGEITLLKKLLVG
ncbi:MAG: DegT/DnrJ/EryC1/StrS family aminotransferase [Candidatus Paceibacterota bacterium]|jgi:CDP-6-deoxy-D-xylo-4-hexulose-3-dehydrase